MAARGSASSGESYFDGHKLGSGQRKFLVFLAIAYAFDQMDMLLFSKIAPVMIAQYGWTMQQVANCNSVGLIGMFCGAVFGGWMADKIGVYRFYGSAFLYGIWYPWDGDHSDGLYFGIDAH